MELFPWKRCLELISVHFNSFYWCYCHFPERRLDPSNKTVGIQNCVQISLKRCHSNSPAERHLHLLLLLASSRQQVTKTGDQGRDGETSSWPGIAFQMKSCIRLTGWILTRGKMAKLLPITNFSDWFISNSFGEKKINFLKICSCCEYRASLKILVFITQCPKTLSLK